MAGFEFTAQTVEEAKTDIYGPIIEMQSLLAIAGVMNSSVEAESWVNLARGAMERMLGAFELLEQLLREQGHPITFPGTKLGGMGAVAPMTDQQPEIIDADKPRSDALADNGPDSRSDKQVCDYVDNIKKVV